MYQILRTLHAEGLLTFDYALGKWRWDLDAMRAISLPDDVVDVVCAQMQGLSQASQRLLQYAACSGNTFHLQMLQTITEFALPILLQSMREIEQAGLVMCLAKANEFLLLSETSSNPSSSGDGS